MTKEGYLFYACCSWDAQGSQENRLKPGYVTPWLDMKSLLSTQHCSQLIFFFTNSYYRFK